MTIKEVEKVLQVPRATIRFYEKEKLIEPKRGNNSYRDYSDEDIENLKKIIILRKIGVSVSDIENMLDGADNLRDVLSRNITELKKQINELQGAMNICNQMQNNNEEIRTLDVKYYWNEIHSEEKKGNYFMDIAKDVVKAEKRVIYEYFGIADYEGNLMYGPKEAVVRALSVCVFMGILNMMLDRKWTLGIFVEGFTLPLVFIGMYSIVEIPLYFIAKKRPELAKKIRKVLECFCIAILAMLLVMVIVLS